MSGNDGAGQYENYENIPVLGVYTWIEERQMALLAEIQQEEAFAPARQLALTTFALSLLTALILTGGVYFFSRQIARPILAMTNAATRIAEGDLNQMAPVLTQDEIGTLAITFNAMTNQLRETLSGLEQRVAERTEKLSQSQKHTEGLLKELDDITRLARLVNFEFNPKTQMFLFNDRFYETLGTNVVFEDGFDFPAKYALERFVLPIDSERLLSDLNGVGADETKEETDYQFLDHKSQIRSFHSALRLNSIQMDRLQN
ncbi:MAG: cell wall metabolism sensor histidine kinase WalK [Anaerolineae bacterium]|nr:cell wall metabolism sensor histidine kinase WalK [Anaerolineae bacterium]